MIDVDLLSVIRRWHGRDQLSMREIARRTGLSRHTIRKYLASGVTQPKYPPRNGVRKLDPFAETLSIWLERESGRNRKRRRNLLQLHRDLVTLGYAGAYDRVAAFARDWRQRQREADNRASRGTYVPLIFAPRSVTFCLSQTSATRRRGGRKARWRRMCVMPATASGTMHRPSVISLH